LAVLILRIKDPQRDRPFKTPMLKIIAPLGIITNVGLIALLNGLAQKLAIGWLLLGLLVFFIYGQRKSNLNKIDKD
jgi:APA family basic amino acid/polyamine antiporter